MKVSSDMETWKHARVYLDTCALVKLLAPELKEIGTNRLHEYIELGSGIAVQTSQFCIGECLGVLKRKWQNERTISTDGYLIIINRLRSKLDNNRIILLETRISNDVYIKSCDLVKKYDIDYVDATLLASLISNNGKSDCFFTADEKLSIAARGKGVACWNIAKEQAPPKPTA